jgi:uncharacterized protein (TIGR03067 family)
MMAKALPLLAIIILRAFTVAAQDAKDATQQDLDKLQGEWVLASKLRRGVAGEKFTIKGTELENEATDTKGKVFRGKATIKLDATKEPKVFDRTYANGDVRLGIYKLEGDTLTICRAVANSKVRPKNFMVIDNIDDGGGLVLTVWKRASQ